MRWRRRPVGLEATATRHLAGTWSEKDLRELQEAEADFERIDPEIWP